MTGDSKEIMSMVDALLFQPNCRMESEDGQCAEMTTVKHGKPETFRIQGAPVVDPYFQAGEFDLTCLPRT